jgi:hypothetical protein
VTTTASALSINSAWLNCQTAKTRGRYYDHKNWRFSQKQCYDQNLEHFSFILSKKRQFFRRIFRRKYIKNHNIGARILQVRQKSFLLSKDQP